jgi:hypothetical protein
MNYLSRIFPSWFSGYEYKYDKILNETLGFQDWNEHNSAIFYVEEYINIL